MIGAARAGVFSGADAIPDGTVDNFEDGDLTVLNDDWSGWSGETASLSAQQTNVINGDFSGELTSSNANNIITATRNISNQPTEVSYLTRPTARNGSSTDRISIRMISDGSTLAVVELVADGSVGVNFSDVSGSWNLDTTYQLRIHNIDFTNNNFDWQIVENDTDTIISSGIDEPFYNGNTASDADSVGVQSASNSIGDDVDQVFDDVVWVS